MIEIAITLICARCRRRFKPEPVIRYDRIMMANLQAERKMARSLGWRLIRPQVNQAVEDFCPECAEAILAGPTAQEVSRK